MPNLIIQTGPAKGRSFALSGKVQCLGREGDIQILDTAASRRHAEVFPMGTRLFIRDLSSRNGTYVNDLKIAKETMLRGGDRVRIGSSFLLFTEEAEPPVEFVQDGDGSQTATMEIRLGERSAQIVSGDKQMSGTMTRLFTMYEVARTLGRETSIQGVADKVVELAMTALTPSYCYVFFRDEAGGNLEAKAWRDKQTPRKISRSIVTRAMQLRHSILTADAAADARFKESESVVSAGIRSVLCAPLLARDRINGVLYMGRDRKPFDHADLELATAVAFQAGMALENVTTFMERRWEYMALAKKLAGAMDLRLDGMRGHSERVAAYAAAIADRLRLGADESEDIVLAAFLHDVGKMKVTENTRQAVGAALGHPVQDHFCHAWLGAKLLEQLPSLAPILPGIRYHHERLDGFGGPEGLSGEAVPLIARIVGAANRFDHLVSDPMANGRPMPVSEALATIQQPGEGMDDAVIHALIEAQTTGSGIGLPKLVLQEFD